MMDGVSKDTRQSVARWSCVAGLVLGLGFILCCARSQVASNLVGSPDNQGAGPKSAAARRDQASAGDEWLGHDAVAFTDGLTTSDRPGADARIPIVDVLRFERVLEVSVCTIAIDKNNLGVLADDPWFMERGRWKKVPLPTGFGGCSESSEGDAGADGTRGFWEMFFGRDNKPRLMGYQGETSQGAARMPIYMRFTNNAWRPGWEEIGRLGRARPGALYGVLGNDDPEVVCKEGEQCIVKRQTGWKTIDAEQGVCLVRLCGSQPWAIRGAQVYRLAAGDERWDRVADNPPWAQASSFWATDGKLWVIADQGKLYMHDGGTWVRVASPVGRASDVWAASANEVWIAGQAGVGFYDGTQWVRAAGIQGAMRRVVGRGPGDIWVGGESGLWHGVMAAPQPDAGPS